MFSVGYFHFVHESDIAAFPQQSEQLKFQNRSTLRIDNAGKRFVS